MIEVGQPDALSDADDGVGADAEMGEARVAERRHGMPARRQLRVVDSPGLQGPRGVVQHEQRVPAGGLGCQDDLGGRDPGLAREERQERLVLDRVQTSEAVAAGHNRSLGS